MLSSCSSAIGVAVGADELLGLVSALISLGSAGVVASVVPVNDPATVPLMTALHDHLRAGSDLAGALTLARHAVSDNPVAQATAYSSSRWDLSGPGSQAHPVGDQVPVWGLAPQPDLPAAASRRESKRPMSSASTRNVVPSGVSTTISPGPGGTIWPTTWSAITSSSSDRCAAVKIRTRGWPDPERSPPYRFQRGVEGRARSDGSFLPA